MELNRKPTKEELLLIEILIQKSNVQLSDNWKNNLLVRSMQDEKMGSLYLYPDGEINDNRQFGEQVGEYQFKDSDDIAVIASLYIDTKGKLLELDIWKTDYSPLIKYPDKIIPNL